MAARDVIRVGNPQPDYATARNFEDLPYRGVEFRRTWHLLRGPNFLVRRLLGRTQTVFQYLHCDFGLNDVDLLHFFNTLSVSSTPWVTTFETVVPRWRPGSRFGTRLLARKQCRKLIALSQAAYDLNAAYCQRHPDLAPSILEKTVVLHPPQRQLVSCYADKPLPAGEPLVFTLVGRQFSLKGGAETLWAFDRLLDEGYPVMLNLVSRLDAPDHINPDVSAAAETARSIIARHPGRIVHRTELAPAEVLDLFRRSHVGMLPSYDETYGYAVLEAQASGCPVVTTTVRALPEANHADFGYLVEVPTDEFREGRLANEAQRKRFSEQLRAGLYEILRHICEHPEELPVKGDAALGKIARENDPCGHARALERIYREALGC